MAPRLRAGTAPPPVLFSPPDSGPPEDDFRDDLGLYPVEETNTLCAISSLPILIPLVSVLVGKALICRSDLHTCLPIQDIFMT